MLPPDAAPYGTRVFTADSVHATLRKVIPENSTRGTVGRGDPACTQLASTLNVLREQIHGWRGPFSEERERGEAIGGSIKTLIALLPQLIEGYEPEISRDVANWRRFENEEIPASLKRAKFALEHLLPASAADLAAAEHAKLQALKNLLEAAEDAWRVQVPIMLDRLAAVGRAPQDKWEWVAERILESAKVFVPGISDASIHELIVEVMPDITGDKLNTAQVKKSFQRKNRTNTDGDKLH
jgi:hypothetical protein